MRRLAIDLRPLRASRDLRLLMLGNAVSGLGTQAALVALPYQVYVQTESALLTGLLGGVELAPMILMSLWAGALADRADRRALLLADQVALAATTSALAVMALAGWTPLLALYALAGLLAAFGAVQNVVRTAMVPGLVEPAHLASAMALQFGVSQLTRVIGPALAGVLIGAFGVAAAYTADAVSCLAMVGAVLAMAPQRRHDDRRHPGTIRSIVDGLRFVRGNQAIVGTFAIDLVAMTFGMPRALFPVLAVGVYGAGPEGVGVLHAAVSAGATIAALMTGWVAHTRRHGRVVVWAVVAWGTAIALAGLAGTLWLAALLLAVAGGADSISAVCRSTINQTVTPDRMRGRVSAAYMLVVTGGPRLGDMESGGAAALLGAQAAVVTGGAACIVGVAAIAVAFPALVRYDAGDWIEEVAPDRSPFRQPASEDWTPAS